MMDVWPIMFINHDTGVVGMYSICYTSEAEAEAEIASLKAEGSDFEYITKSLTLQVTYQ